MRRRLRSTATLYATRSLAPTSATVSASNSGARSRWLCVEAITLAEPVKEQADRDEDSRHDHAERRQLSYLAVLPQVEHRDRDHCRLRAVQQDGQWQLLHAEEEHVDPATEEGGHHQRHDDAPQ